MDAVWWLLSPTRTLAYGVSRSRITSFKRASSGASRFAAFGLLRRGLVARTYTTFQLVGWRRRIVAILWRGGAGGIWKGSEGHLVEAPAISPDANRAAILLRRQGRVGLFFINTDGAALKEGNSTVDVRGTVAWSPDGKWIAAGGVGPSGPGLYKIPVDGGDAIQIRKEVATDPIWSLDNKLIAFTGAGLGRYRPLLALTPDGTPFELPDIRVSQVPGERFRFTPDSKAIVYIEGQLRLQNFRLLDLATKQTRPLTQFHSPAVMRSFDFTPDSKQIIFDRLFENSDIVMIDLLIENTDVCARYTLLAPTELSGSDRPDLAVPKS